MKYKAYMTAFKTKADTREIEIPNEAIKDKSQDQILELIYKHGQNDFQSMPSPSISVGDIIELEGRYFMVRPFGFSEISKEDFDKVDEFAPLGSSAYSARENIFETNPMMIKGIEAL
jgi:hypothetical protein